MHVASGNFGMAMNAVHYIEAFRFISGSSPSKVTAWFDDEALPNPRGPQFQDVSGSLRIQSKEGHRLYIDASSDQGHGVQVTYLSRNGRVSVDELSGYLSSTHRVSKYRDLPTTRYGCASSKDSFELEPLDLVSSTASVIKSLLDGQNYPNVDDASLAVKALIAAYHSHRNGNVEIRLEDIPDENSEVFPWA